ncbi:uncharacterized protein LOC144597050 [Rhinoraja longicauda]
MTQPQIPHERAVDTFLGFLKNELLKIPENVWFNYTVAAMMMAHNFSQPTLQQMGYIGQQQMGQAQMGLMGPPQQTPLTGPPHCQIHKEERTRKGKAENEFTKEEKEWQLLEHLTLDADR